MAYYLVTAKPKEDGLARIKEKLHEKAFMSMRPFGKALTFSLENARSKKNGYVVWEEEDYCSPPLKEEREAVLDTYFENLRTEKVGKGDGWSQIKNLPKLFPELAKG